MGQRFGIRQGIFGDFGTEKLASGALDHPALEFEQHSLLVAAGRVRDTALTLDDLFYLISVLCLYYVNSPRFLPLLKRRT